MENNQQPKPYDAVLGGKNPPPIDAAVLGGIEVVKLRLNNENPEVRIKALHQALNYGEPGLDLIIKALDSESPQVQIEAYSLLVLLSEQKVKRALLEFNTHNLKFEPIETVTVNRCGEIVQRQQHLAKYFVENLVNGINLEMAYIPGGTFLMGSLEDEKNSYKSERPQHEVTIKPFFMGKFLITKAQWKAVEKLPKIEQDLKPDSFRWIGTDCPVEFVDWDIAIEFCARLSKATGKKYRLPTEAEWEYACRAGTTTPFRYGETITSELANYRADQSRSTYAQESFGEYRQKIIPVGQFLPNAFGLYDMHGNGAEWCQDVWHDNYEGAPTDGSAWIDNDEKDRERVIRGGAWLTDVRICRSAARFGFEPTNKYESRYRHEIGSFRIVSNVF